MSATAIPGVRRKVAPKAGAGVVSATAIPGVRRKVAPKAAADGVEDGVAKQVIAAVGPWRDFVGRWLESAGCQVADAARGDWEVTLSVPLQRRWRRQRVRLVFDPLRATLPRGAWFTAPGSGAGRKILEAAREEPIVTRRTALPQVPGAPEEGLASVCRVRGLSWGPARLGPVRYERRFAFHAVVTLWGGLPAQEPWTILLSPDGNLIEWHRGDGLPDARARDGLYQITEDLEPETRQALAARAREHLVELVVEREREWEGVVGKLRDDELGRLSAFFAARVEEEEERLRHRTPSAENGSDIQEGDATSLKLEWERRAQEVRHRWALRTEVRVWGLEEWAWPVAELEQELRAGAVHLRLTSSVDVARGRPAAPGCPTCGAPADLLMRLRGSVACVNCGPR